MSSLLLPIHHELAGHSRLRAAVSAPISELKASMMLVAFGALSTVCLVCFDFKLRIPGNAILRIIFPVVLGLAAVPRHRSGTLMSLSAAASAILMQSLGFRIGVGSMTSLVLIGPCLDLCLRRVGNGRWLYGGMMGAGLLCNLLALTIRAATKFGGWDGIGTRPFVTWWQQAVVSYVACGLIAGLLSAIVWFRFRTDVAPHADADSTS